MNVPASAGDRPRKKRSFGDPLTYYQERYLGLTSGELRVRDQSFYECLRLNKLLGLIPGRGKRIFHDPVAYYREHYAGLKRGELQKRDPSLYQRLRRDGLLAGIPLK